MKAVVTGFICYAISISTYAVEVIDKDSTSHLPASQSTVIGIKEDN